MTRWSRSVVCSMLVVLAAAILSGLVLILPTTALSPVAATPLTDFDAFVDRYIAGSYAFRPDQATRDGVHEHDRRLAGFSRGEIDSEIVRLKDARTALIGMRIAALDTARLVDYQMLNGLVQSRILDLETIRRWEKDPGYYLDIATAGIYSLTARPFAPAPERMKSVIEREKMIGPVLAAAIENLKSPPRIWTEAAIENAQGAVEFFRTTVPAAFASAAADPALRAEFDRMNGVTVQQMESFVGYLRDDLLPVSNGDFRLGAEVIQKKLLYDEICDVPLYRLERYGDNELKKLQLEVISTAAKIDSAKSPADLFRVLSMDHPDPNRLVDETGRLVEGIRQFCLDRDLVTFPTDDRCRVAATPQFAAGGGFALTDVAGPFEKDGRDAFLYVTPPPDGWNSMKQDDYMRAYNRYGLPIVVMHEAYPGHFLQSQWRANAPTRLRKISGSAAFSDGWALYCEEMMLDQNYEDNDPRYRLFQLRWALLETCRYLAAIRMHGGAMTYDQAVDFFTREAFQEPVNAQREARRATLDAAGLFSQLGRMQILKLREDYKRYRGDRFSLREFHDRLLGSGAPPLKLIRQLLMPGDKGTVL